MIKNKKIISTILLFAIIFILITIVIILILQKLGIMKNIITDYEKFDDKRKIMEKIYKNDDILDPDEDPEDEGDDPDAIYGADPDSQYNSIN